MADVRFYIERVFTLQSRNLVVLAGEILHGVVSPGMRLLVHLNRSTNVGFDVHSVEYLDNVDGSKRSIIALAFHYRSDDERDFLIDLNLGDEEVDLVIMPPSKD